jgi:hypothetical protein
MEEKIIKNVTRNKTSVIVPVEDEIATPIIDQADQREKNWGEKESLSQGK